MIIKAGKIVYIFLVSVNTVKKFIIYTWIREITKWHSQGSLNKQVIFRKT